MKRIGIAFAAFLLCQTANAQYVDGNTLFKWCSSDRGAAETYSMGVYDSFWLAGASQDNANLALCAPQGVSSVQIRDIVCKALENTPESRHWSGAVLTWNAINKAFPCP